jgi:glycerophosphoryl diester phosphodiesterase
MIRLAVLILMTALPLAVAAHADDSFLLPASSPASSPPASSAPPSFAPLPHLKHPIAVIAHRAGRGIMPENTMAAIRNAIKLGVDYVELDIRATQDGHLVIMHDSSVDRTTNGKGNVRDLDFATIESLDAGSKFDAKYVGEKVPTFDDVLAVCRNHVHIYVDHKQAPTEQVYAAIKAHGMEKQVVVYNGTRGLQEWKAIAPHIPVMPSLPDEYRKPGGVAEYEQILAAEVLDGNLVEWTKELVDQAHALGVKVYVDNLGPNDNPAGFHKAIEMGVDGIQTDYPDQLIAYLKENPPQAGR